MEAYISTGLNLLVRWLHVIAGVAWIGASFYFVWLDNHLVAPRTRRTMTKAWAARSGPCTVAVFTTRRNTRLRRSSCPTPALVQVGGVHDLAVRNFPAGLVYWYGAEVYLIDRSVADLSSRRLLALRFAFIVGGWLVYDLLCKSPLARDDTCIRGRPAAPEQRARVGALPVVQRPGRVHSCSAPCSAPSW